MPFTPDELTYYARQLSLDTIGPYGQQKLKNARVLCVGAGGLGCSLLLYLTAAGIGKLGIIDPDQVDISNLHRQILYTQDDIGLSKTEVAYRKLSRLNPHIELIPYPIALTHENIFELVNTYDIIADCTDNFSTRYLINDACFYLKKPNVQASISQFSGQCSIFTTYDGPCYRCLFDSPPSHELIPTCAEAGVFGALPGLIGNLQAIEIIKLITGIGIPLIGKLLTVDTLSMIFKTFTISRNPHCKLCQYGESFESLTHTTQTCRVAHFEEHIEEISPASLKQLKEKNEIFILDVRDLYEYEICNIGGYLIPLPELSNRLNELNPHQKIAIHCKKGPRSQKAAIMLKQAGFKQIVYLAGGILAWKEQVDPSLVGY